MNKTAIKNFAIWARNKLITDISYRAGLMGITADGIHPALPQSTGQTKFYDIGTPEPYAISGEAIHQREHLADLIRRKAKDSNYQTAYKYIIEEVAYTWFNRLIAVRFMEVNDYLPSHIRVLSSDQGKIEPDLVTTPFDADLDFTKDEQNAIIDLKSENKLDELFRLLFIKQCNALNEILPALFEKTNDYTELLLNLSVIDQDGVIYHLVHDVPEEDFDIERGGQVEIIGWLYQYYNTEPKNAAFAKKGKITKEEIPAVTQLFTPDWIVRYMVENSLGRLWIEHLLACGDFRTEAEIAADFEWKYYLPEAEQEPEVTAQLAKIREERRNLTPEEIRCIDPCMGSGHICVYLFSVLMQIYESAGYGQRDAARSILENNLYGLDIDDRAFQMAYFAVMMKAREYNRRILNGENKPNLFSIQESNGIDRSQLQLLGRTMGVYEREASVRDMNELLDIFMDAKEYGSILTVKELDWDRLERFAEDVDSEQQISMASIDLEETVAALLQMIRQGRCFAQKYDITCTNPPYMVVNSGSGRLNKYVREEYSDYKTDLFSVFIEKCKRMLKPNGIRAMVTMHAWMFLGSFEKLRESFGDHILVNMAHLGTRAFEEIGGEVVQTTSFITENGECIKYRGTFVRLVSENTQQKKENAFLSGANRYYASQEEFISIPGRIIAYWVDKRLFEIFREIPPISNTVDLKVGLQTGDNNYFYKGWFEVSFREINWNADQDEQNKTSCLKWYPCIKGGSYRRWYGNKEIVVNWKNNGREIRNCKSSVVRNTQYYFLENLSWSEITGGKISFRYNERGSVFDQKGPCCFTNDFDRLLFCAAFLNSSTAQMMLNVLCPTLDYSVGPVSTVPFINIYNKEVAELAHRNINISKEEWDSYEYSWEFKKSPLVIDEGLLETSWIRWNKTCDQRINETISNEEYINRYFLDLYSINSNEMVNIDLKDIALRRADKKKDIKDLISYAVGCMFGRYSLDIEGLATPVANGIAGNINLLFLMQITSFQSRMKSTWKMMLLLASASG